MEKIFALLNQMEADGVIGRYAIGGAVGSIFWLEPITTQDVDVFVMLPTAPGGLLLTGADLRIPAWSRVPAARAVHHRGGLGH